MAVLDQTAVEGGIDHCLWDLVQQATLEATARLDDVTPEVSGLFSYTNDDKTWGVGLNASYAKRESGSVQATVNTWNYACRSFAKLIRPSAQNVI